MPSDSRTPAGLPVLPVPQHPAQVGVVGGGIAGLVALRDLTHPAPDGPPLEAVLYERRPGVGGVWRLDAPIVKHEREHGPSRTNGRWPLRLDEHDDRQVAWPSPAYPQLRGNVLPRFLKPALGPRFPRPKDADTFPTLTETEEYILSYLSGQADQDKRVRTNTDVLGLWELPTEEPTQPQREAGYTAQSGGWLIAVRHVRTGQVVLQHLHAAVLASGWYDHANLPPAKGLREAIEQGQAIHHAKWYRGPEPYFNRKVIVVGNGNSANDMAAHIAQQYPDPKAYDHDPTYQKVHTSLKGAQPEGSKDLDQVLGPVRVYRSIRAQPLPMFPSLKDRRIEDVPEIVSVTVREGKMDVELLGGRILEGVDAILYGTGYNGFRYPFARVWSRPLTIEEAKTVTSHARAVLDSQSPVHAQTVQAVSHAAVQAYGQGTAHSPFAADDGQPAWIQNVEKALWGPAWVNAWESLHPEPRGTVQEEWEQASSPSSFQSAWSPARIAGTHKQTLYARNPSLAFAGLPVSFTPFSAVDAYMWYVRSLWDGSLPPTSVGLGTDYAARLADETERVKYLRQVRESAAPSHIPGPDAGTRNGWTPPQPKGNISYHTLPPEEPEFLSNQLAEPVLRVKPWLANYLDPYNAEEREAERSGQYGVKLRTVAEYAVKGFSQVGPSGPVPGVGTATLSKL